jgi:hypothetical protein
MTREFLPCVDLMGGDPLGNSIGDFMAARSLVRAPAERREKKYKRHTWGGA